MSTSKHKTVIAIVVTHDDEGIEGYEVTTDAGRCPFDELEGALDFMARHCERICEEDRTKQQEQSE